MSGNRPSKKPQEKSKRRSEPEESDHESSNESSNMAESSPQADAASDKRLKTCPICGHRDNQRNLARHIARAHGQMQCILCNKSVPQLENGLHAHLVADHNKFTDQGDKRETRRCFRKMVSKSPTSTRPPPPKRQMILRQSARNTKKAKEPEEINSAGPVVAGSSGTRTLRVPHAQVKVPAAEQLLVSSLVANKEDGKSQPKPPKKKSESPPKSRRTSRSRPAVNTGVALTEETPGANTSDDEPETIDVGNDTVYRAEPPTVPEVAAKRTGNQGHSSGEYVNLSRQPADYAPAISATTSRQMLVSVSQPQAVTSQVFGGPVPTSLPLHLPAYRPTEASYYSQPMAPVAQRQPNPQLQQQVARPQGQGIYAPRPAQPTGFLPRQYSNAPNHMRMGSPKAFTQADVDQAFRTGVAVSQQADRNRYVNEAAPSPMPQYDPYPNAYFGSGVQNLDAEYGTGFIDRAHYCHYTPAGLSNFGYQGPTRGVGMLEGRHTQSMYTPYQDSTYNMALPGSHNSSVRPQTQFQNEPIQDLYYTEYSQQNRAVANVANYPSYEQSMAEYLQPQRTYYPTREMRHEAEVELQHHSWPGTQRESDFARSGIEPHLPQPHLPPEPTMSTCK